MPQMKWPLSLGVVTLLLAALCPAQPTFIDAAGRRVVAGSGLDWRSWGAVSWMALPAPAPFAATLRPASIPLTAPVNTAAAGLEHALYLTSSGAVLSAGRDDFGELGRGTGAAYPVFGPGTPRVEDAPTPTVLTNDIVGVEAGWGVSFAWSTAGFLNAWGTGATGWFGTGVSLPSTDLPVIVPVPADVLEVSNFGGMVVARDTQGFVWHWGIDQTFINIVPITQVAGLAGATAVAAYRDVAWAITAGGNLWTWTLANPVPVLITGLPPVQAVVAGQFDAIALDMTGTPWSVRGTSPPAWGYTDFLTVAPPVGGAPRIIDSLSNIVDIALTPAAGYALDSAGEIWVWGRDDTLAGLGLGSGALQIFVPQRIPSTGGILTPTNSASGCTVPATVQTLTNLGAATLGAEINLVSESLSGASWLFLAPGAAETNPWFPLGPCGAFLSVTGLQIFLNQGFGPFLGQGIIAGLSRQYWSFQLPNDPAILGLTFTAQALVLGSAQTPGVPVLTNALTYTVQ